MKKNLTEIRQKIAWVQKILRAPKLSPTARQRSITYLSALVLMLSKGQKAMAETAPYDREETSTEIKAEVREDSSDKTFDSSNTLELLQLSTEEVFKYHNIEQVSLAEIKNVCSQQEFEFSGEELRAMKPGTLANAIAKQAGVRALGKKCLGKCFSGFKDVLFSNMVKKLIKQVDDSYLPDKRWNTLSAHRGKQDMETLPQFICSKLAYKNYKDVPDGTGIVFMPNEKHKHGHIVWKYGNYFLSDGQEIIENIPEGKYGQAYAFFPVDNTMDIIPQSEHLTQLATNLKIKNIPQPKLKSLVLENLSKSKPGPGLAFASRD